MILHTINKSPYTHNSLQTCSQFCAEGDAIILLEDGVYAITHPGVSTLLDEKFRVYAIEADVLARGLQKKTYQPTGDNSVILITYDRFVEICVEFPKQKNW